MHPTIKAKTAKTRLRQKAEEERHNRREKQKLGALWAWTEAEELKMQLHATSELQEQNKRLEEQNRRLKRDVALNVEQKAVVAKLGQASYEFIRLPDGSFVPPRDGGRHLAPAPSSLLSAPHPPAQKTQSGP